MTDVVLIHPPMFLLPFLPWYAILLTFLLRRLSDEIDFEYPEA